MVWKYVCGTGASSLKVSFPERPEKDTVLFSSGVYLTGARDRIYALSERCPHLGCRLAYNEAEHCFQCPCHGSQFSPKGSLQKGPATKDMNALDIRFDEECGLYQVILPLS